MIQISFFVNKEHKARVMREVVPRLGETIIIDCGEMFRVVDVIHQWDDPGTIQINTVPIEAE